MSAECKENSGDDSFWLYDLRVEVAEPRFPMVCSHRVGDFFEVRGENLIFARDTSFSMYALSALLPLLPAKQRGSDPNDWMTTDALIACPDPNCGGLFKISRLGRRKFFHGECTAEPLIKKDI
ncbi:MAG: TIGR04076 family protein [Synergistaceae bacterium]|jgi:uncharacterized repeat protein (TIGR04076 family)|nr:TIGR04076 family protein [Synergistaceae bacterium]